MVAIGASAGGLEALTTFFAALTAPVNAAFVVIQHLSPDHRSMMDELLSRHTTLPVQEAVAGESLVGGRVYLMPPAVLMTLQHDQLEFAPRPQHGVPLPIDGFLRSLAQSVASQSIGVVLSGSGSDGAAGAAALRTAGGFVLVQKPESAKFDGMPRSALSATLADAVLEPRELARTVASIVAGRAGRVGEGELVDMPSLKPALQRLFEQLQSHAGVDFTQYKLPTIMRRIERRMQAVGCQTVNDYADHVAADPTECELLRRELLIPVTAFFRDPAAFEALGQMLRERLRSAGGREPLRIWSAGCATGEEPYSLAMAVLEACHDTQVWPGFKIFATDVDQRFLDIAAEGLYPAAAVEDLSPERQEQHFASDGHQVKVRESLRQFVMFVRHDMLRDAPFTKIDLLVCRNTLIYFQIDAQERAMRRLQYALRPGGVLFLGRSESLGPLQPDFHVIDRTHKLFRVVRPVLATQALRDGISSSPTVWRRWEGHRAKASAANQTTVDSALQALVSDYVPVSLLIGGVHHLIHAWGPTERYLRVPSGQPNLDVIRLLPPRLGAVTALSISRAMADGRYTSPVLPVAVDGVDRLVRVVARRVDVPLPADAVASGAHPEPCALVCIEEMPPQDTKVSVAGSDMVSDHDLVRLDLLERELADTRLTLQTSIEELESANEELQATNEELMSSNEELQSTNEELQSVNEELYTVNAEYNGKLEQVSALNADLEGMSRATGVATLFVDDDLKLIRFTPEAARLFRLRPDDVGRRLTDFSGELHYPQLAADTMSVLGGGRPVERTLEVAGQPRHLVRVVGYSGGLGGRQRAVLTLIDISRLDERAQLQRVIDALPEHIAVLDSFGTVVQVNQAWVDFALANRAQGQDDDGRSAIGTNYLAVAARAEADDDASLLTDLRALLAGNRDAVHRVYPCHSPSERRWFVLSARPLPPWSEGQPGGAVVSHYNITRWVTDDEPQPIELD